MYTLYYSKGNSALAAHIVLEEVGAPHELIEVSVPDGAHQAPEYLAINPKARLPTLISPEGKLTENTAILIYLGQRFPEAGLMPEGRMGVARVAELLSYIATTAHVAFAHKLRGARWADDPAAVEAMKAKVPDNMREAGRYLEATYMQGSWALGTQYTVCDPFLLLVGRWLKANGIDLAEFPKLAAHAGAMSERPAVKAAFRAQGL